MDVLALPSDIETYEVELPDTISTVSMGMDVVANTKSIQNSKTNSRVRKQTAVPPVKVMPTVVVPESAKLNGSRKDSMASLPGEPDMPSWLSTHLHPAINPRPIQDDLMETFPHPRIVPLAQIAGLNASKSIDVLTGWDLLEDRAVIDLFKEIHYSRPLPSQVIVLSPCTAFTNLQSCNWSRVDKAWSAALAVAGIRFLDIATWIINLQLDAGRFFVLEHPDGALVATPRHCKHHGA